MEDSFRARVDKVFGSLSSSSSSSSTAISSSLWSLTDEEIEKKEWNRQQQRDPAYDDADVSPDCSFPSNLDGFCAPQSEIIPKFADIREQLQDLRREDDEDEEGDDYSDGCNDGDIKRKKKVNNPRKDKDDDDELDFDIRSSIGLDCTLDFEDEEDEFDKVAVGREKASDRFLYMKDAVGYGPDTNPHHELPVTVKNVRRDPRANHMAAKLRLQEDAETAGDFDSLKLSDAAVAPTKDEQVNQLDNGVAPKPILKKREIAPLDGKPPKRVRFEAEFPGTKDTEKQSSPIGATSSPGEAGFSVGEAKATDEVFSLPLNSSISADEGAQVGKDNSYSVPDYLRNPSSYTRYTLDSTTDMDEASNRKACLEKPNGEELLDSSVGFPKALIFTPKKKANDTKVVRKENDESKDKGFPVSIAADGDAEDGDSAVCMMEEDKADIEDDKSCNSQKQGRKYRTRNHVSDDDHVAT